MVNIPRQKIDEIIAKTGEPPCLRAIDGVIAHNADLIAKMFIIMNKNNEVAHGSIRD